VPARPCRRSSPRAGCAPLSDFAVKHPEVGGVLEQAVEHGDRGVDGCRFEALAYQAVDSPLHVKRLEIDQAAIAEVRDDHGPGPVAIGEDGAR
jgi:hypothetical protein